MTDASPENDDWLRTLIARSPILPEQSLRTHWQRLVPWLNTSARYELAAVLLEVEHATSSSR